MKQFNKTALFSLKKGDRFYYLSDKVKKVYQVTQTNSCSCWVKKDTELHPKEIKTDKTVIFLRHSDEDN